MDKEELLSVLRQIEQLIRDTLDPVERHRPSSRKRISKAKHSKAKNSEDTLPDKIIALRDADFFSHPQTPIEVHAKLKSTYRCDLNRVTMALLRLQRRKMLRKTSKLVDKRKITAYVW